MIRRAKGAGRILLAVFYAYGIVFGSWCIWSQLNRPITSPKWYTFDSTLEEVVDNMAYKAGVPNPFHPSVDIDPHGGA
jgi:hypothetical protein